MFFTAGKKLCSLVEKEKFQTERRCTVRDIDKIITHKNIFPLMSPDPNGIFDVKSSNMKSWHVGFL